MRRPNCGHTEGGTNRDGLVVDLHDCDYVEARNALIPEAEREALAASPLPMVQARVFMQAMSRLAREQGLARQ